MGIWILVCVMFILFYFLFPLPFFFLTPWQFSLVLIMVPDDWKAEGKLFISIQQILEKPSYVIASDWKWSFISPVEYAKVNEKYSGKRHLHNYC